jgi:hypothetical protein
MKNKKNKDILLAIIFNAIIISVMYLFISIYYMTFDIKLWGKELRCIFCFLSAASTILGSFLVGVRICQNS